jgi:hypothetical protein
MGEQVCIVSEGGKSPKKLKLAVLAAYGSIGRVLGMLVRRWKLSHL